MIEAIDKNLNRSIDLLNSITNEQYSDKSVAPYHSSIGTHIRHILDVFTCIFEGLDNGFIDFSKRKRRVLSEEVLEEGIKYIKEVQRKLIDVNSNSFDQIIDVYDDLGAGRVVTKYTLGSALVQAHSHAIHHYASVGYIIYQLGIDLPDSDFGYNPTTRKK